jgi:hypothetical protein
MAPEGLAGMEDFMGQPARTQERTPAHSVGSIMEGLREATPSGDSPASTEAEADSTEAEADSTEAEADSTGAGEGSTEAGEATEAEAEK